MIRDIHLKDKEQWEKLYKSYADFYKVEMNDKILQTVWKWLHDKSHEVNGLVYEVDGNIVGLAHYRRMPSPLRGQDIGFLDDLFVDPEHRGQRIGENLINKLKEISKSKRWNLVRWITREDNLRAKSLYNRVSEKTTWDVYELKLKNN
jgi:ribosomal protein S18 acetylase RimI-like enzyme